MQDFADAAGNVSGYCCVFNAGHFMAGCGDFPGADSGCFICAGRAVYHPGPAGGFYACCDVGGCCADSAGGMVFASRYWRLPARVCLAESNHVDRRHSGGRRARCIAY